MADLPHIRLTNTVTSHPYTSPGQGGGEKKSPPKPERKTHAQKLLSDLDRATTTAQKQMDKDPTRKGMQFIPIRVDKSSEFELKIQSLENNAQQIRIISSMERGGIVRYLLGIPNDKVEAFVKKFQDYGDESKETPSGKPKNEPLAVAIVNFESGELEDYWTEPTEVIPEEKIWWEIWLDVYGKDADEVEAWFRRMAEQQNVLVSGQRVLFPDRLVILGFADFESWKKFPELLNFLAELRQANIATSEFTSLTPKDQGEFVDDLLCRTSFASDEAPMVTILDGGVDRGHPLLANALADSDTQSWKEEWGADDKDGHGTLMAGVCLYGDLKKAISGSLNLELTHNLESVKVLPDVGQNDPPDYGPITVGAMAMAEAQRPDNSRAFCMAVTASCDDLWRPTLWSATIDQACAGSNDGLQRLMIVSAGNVREEPGKNYPADNHVSSIEDPAQSWNALTIGAYTNLAWIQEEGLEDYTPIAKPGTLAPASRTSLTWTGEPWPYKPDVVFEGGNYAVDDTGFITGAVDLQSLTTQSPQLGHALLGTICDTSGATAAAAHMAGVLQAEYSDFWPETIRGLIVHSAEWTPEMIEEFGHGERRQRLRVYGMGVPSIGRARRSAKGFTTMVIQEEIQPFKREGSDSVTNEMHIHDLPISRDVLEQLGELEVKMRVTLSYFVEPNPPRRGFVAQYQYASHGLRFSVRRPQESPERMGKRLSRQFWDKDDAGNPIRPEKGSTVEDDRNWELGERTCVRGSIHSDCWTGTAAQLASSNLIAVYPVTGWWRYRSDLEIVSKKTRYSLIVSIETADETVDLYAMVENEISTRTELVAETKVEIETDIGE